MNQKIIIIVLIVLVVLLTSSTAYFVIAKSKTQRGVSALSENTQKLEQEVVDLKATNKGLEKELSQIRSSALSSCQMAPELIGAALEEARSKARIALIKSSMSAAMPAGIICRDTNKTILSGNSGDKVCIGGDYTWTSIDVCGPNPSDAKWVVKKGNTDNWDFVLDCKEFPNCNGPQNAICNSGGCEFAGSC